MSLRIDDCTLEVMKHLNELQDCLDILSEVTATDAIEWDYHVHMIRKKVREIGDN